MSSRVLEIACFNLESALLAQAAGADRIELCVNYAIGGVSPSLSLLKEARKNIYIPLYAMVRPQPADFPYSISPPETFHYSEAEVQWMIHYIMSLKQLGFDGAVMGALTKTNQVDTNVCERLIGAADGMPLTFHRAIDRCEDIGAAMAQLADLGVKRVLSSGGKNAASEHVSYLRELQEKIGDKIILMPGGGIRSNTIEALLSTGCKEFHSAAITGSAGLADPNEIQTLKQFLTTRA